MNHFFFCAIYPVIRTELDDAKEVVVWPPDDDESQAVDPIAEAQALIDGATTLARIFVVQAPDDETGADCLRLYFAEQDVVPYSLTVLNVDFQSYFLEPLQDKREATCCYGLPVLFVVQTLDADSTELLHEFCCNIVAGDIDG